MKTKLAILGLGAALIAGYGIKTHVDDTAFRKVMSKVSETVIDKDEIASKGNVYLPGYGDAKLVVFGSGFDDETIAKLLSVIGDSKRIVLNIHSPGGVVDSLVTLQKFVAAKGIEVHTVVGKGHMAASCGAMTFMIGKTRTIAYGGEVLFHKSGGMAPDGRRNETYVRDAISTVIKYKAEILTLAAELNSADPGNRNYVLQIAAAVNKLPAEAAQYLTQGKIGMLVTHILPVGGYDGLLDQLKTELGDIKDFDKAFLSESGNKLSPEALDRLLKSDGNNIYRYGEDAEAANVATHSVM